MRSGCLVLCYHAVSDTWDDPLATRPQVLERQLKRLLARGHKPVDAHGVLHNQPGTLHVTFDDAYRSVAGVVELLEELAVAATLFVCSALAEHGDHFRVPELRERLPVDDHELLTMSWSHLGELAERGMEIGSHTVSHRSLPELGQDELYAELTDSRAEIEARLGRPCRLLAYPYGHHDARVRAAARAAGYVAAYTLEPPRGIPHPYALPRVGVYRADNDLRFALKTSRSRQLAMAARSRSAFRPMRGGR